jgi:hypothetical protein
MRVNRLIAATLLAILMCPAIMADPLNGSDTGAAEKSCRAFVQSFYKWYLSKPLADRAYKEKAGCFSPELLKQLTEDYAASQKVSGEVVGLDFDPFLSTNAEPHAKYVATKVTKKANNYLVQVDGSGGNRADHTRLLPEVAQKEGKCQFVNFHYADFKSPNDNLVSILKTLREDRRKEGIK